MNLHKIKKYLFNKIIYLIIAGYLIISTVYLKIKIQTSDFYKWALINCTKLFYRSKLISQQLIILFNLNI